MLVVRFKVQAKPERADQLMTAFAAVVPPSRQIDGVIYFDIGRDVSDPNCFVATEIFEDKAALERQESLPEVANVLGILEEALASEPEATIYHVSSSEPWG